MAKRTNKGKNRLVAEGKVPVMLHLDKDVDSHLREQAKRNFRSKNAEIGRILSEFVASVESPTKKVA